MNHPWIWFSVDECMSSGIWTFTHSEYLDFSPSNVKQGMESERKSPILSTETINKGHEDTFGTFHRNTYIRQGSGASCA